MTRLHIALLAAEGTTLLLHPLATITSLVVAAAVGFATSARTGAVIFGVLVGAALLGLRIDAAPGA